MPATVSEGLFVQLLTFVEYSTTCGSFTKKSSYAYCYGQGYRRSRTKKKDGSGKFDFII